MKVRVCFLSFPEYEPDCWQDAIEYIQVASPSFASIERDPLRLILNINSSSEKPFTNTPHLNPLPVSGARQRSAEH